MIKIIDDFLPKIILDQVSSVVLDDSYPWFFLKDTTYRSKYSDDLALWDEGFSSLIYYRHVEDAEPKFTCPNYDEFVPFLLHCEYTIGTKMDELIRFKANLNTTSINSDPFEPHVDTPDMASTTAILYLNDSDGPTYIYDMKCPIGKTTDEALEYYKENKNKCELLTTIPPKRNRLLVFPGEYYHSGSRPCKQKARYNLNINWQRNIKSD